ncbi:unnamed protein product [Triticum aestivum]|uniref:Uncharacterized protein n=1 Tax=Triticum aestivum TaxID=4565 RepID=A0A7H4LIH3_WHEAT|nr:unnamed protein product [Triticum aestivum]
MDGEGANKRRRLKPKPHPASLDFISSLPDDMLLVIIGLLPTKSGVRTALLSRRWRRVPLNLTVDSCLSDGDCKRMAAVSKILSSHPRPARRLDIRMFSTNCKVQPKFDEWFLSPALDQLEELSFEAGRCRSLPPSALRLAPTLHRARFSSCYLPQINAMPALPLPQLKQLDLFDVVISKKAMEHLLCICTALEYLRLEQIHGFISLHITSTNLRWIYVSCWPRNKTSIGKRSLQLFHIMVIENVPFLERLLVSDLEGPTKIRVIDAPTALVHSSAKFSELFIGSVIVQVQHSYSSPSS